MKQVLLVERHSVRRLGECGAELAKLTQHKLLRNELKLSEDRASFRLRAAEIEIDARVPRWDMPEDGEDAKLMATYLSNRSVLVAKALDQRAHP